MLCLYSTTCVGAVMFKQLTECEFKNTLFCKKRPDVKAKILTSSKSVTFSRRCNHNRHYAEHSGYWKTTRFLKQESAASGVIDFYDSNSGKVRVGGGG